LINSSNFSLNQLQPRKSKHFSEYHRGSGAARFFGYRRGAAAADALPRWTSLVVISARSDKQQKKRVKIRYIRKNA